MSRCFPFPPPGYEKKARTDSPDLLEKEKQREKKHKKEKRDKEKRESKEKKEKDRSDGKHREKKERKEKRREKKEKGKDRDNAKISNSDERRLPGKGEGLDGVKNLVENKFPVKSEGHNGEKFIQKATEREKDRSHVSGEKQGSGKYSGGKKLSQNTCLSAGTKDSKFVQELGKRVRDEEGLTGSRLVEKSAGTERKRNEGMVGLVGKPTSSLEEVKQHKKETKGNDRKEGVQGIENEAKSSGNAVVQNLARAVLTRVEGIPKPLEKVIETGPEGKRKTKDKEGDNRHRDKYRDEEREKKSRQKDKERDEQKKKEEKAKIKSEQKNTDKKELKDSNKGDILHTQSTNSLHVPKSNKSSITEGILGKRKDVEMNGFCHVNDLKLDKLQQPICSSHPLTESNKLPPLTSSSHPLTGNGRILDSCRTSGALTSDRPDTVSNHKVDNKERKVNGFIVSQPLSVSTAKPSTTAGKVAEVSMKPPHPDLKYLSKVLSVPRMEVWSDNDDQEWLFSISNSKPKKPKAGSSEDVDIEMPNVWAEAMQIDAADIYALPYVIPF